MLKHELRRRRLRGAFQLFFLSELGAPLLGALRTVGKICPRVEIKRFAEMIAQRVGDLDAGGEAGIGQSIEQRGGLMRGDCFQSFRGGV